jgi:hypothetical protein
MRNIILLSLILFMGISHSGFSQDNLLELLEKEHTSEKKFVTSTFKGSRIINGHSVETKRKGEMDFLISHRFGRVNSGFYNFYGLDQSVIRLGLEYGITQNLTVGAGRNSFEKTYDGYAKYKLVSQQEGKNTIPFSVVAFSSISLFTIKNQINPENDLSFPQRLAFVNQLLIARKFNSSFSLQLMPTLIHRNAVTTGNFNDVLALGAGGRYRLSKRVAVNAEYYHQFQKPQNMEIYNSLSLGFDIETGGHVFQLHLTNSRAMIEKGFITETTGAWNKGDIHFGFNITRSFQVGKHTKDAKW